MLGFRDDPHEILKESHLLAVPSQFHESFGLTIVEAMSLKVPIVATNTGGIPEVLAGDKGGFLVLGNEDEFAQRILSLLKDQELRNQKGEEGYKVYQERFRAEEMSQKYYELLSQ